LKVLVDTNVVLDVFLDREPFADDSSVLLSRVERGQITGLVAATTVTTLYYLCAKGLGRNRAKRELTTLLTILDVAAVNRAVFETALRSQMKDFEDAVLVAAGEHAGVDAIATRNKKDFAASRIPVYTPAELFRLLDTDGPPASVDQ
jgi:predicted nucleic acid-binding protein